MKTWQLGAALSMAATFGGAVGGLIAVRAGGAALPTKAAKEVPSQRDEEDGGLEGEGEDPQVEALRGRIASLERRVSLLMAALARGQDEPNDADEAAQDPGKADVADPVFEAAVLDIMDRERERADGERDARRTELRTQRTQRVSENLAGALGLDEAQKVKMSELISGHFDALRALRSEDNPERPVTPREWREKAAALDQQLQQGLQTVLTPAQLTAYQGLDPDDQISGAVGRSRPRNTQRSEASTTSAR